MRKNFHRSRKRGMVWGVAEGIMRGGITFEM
jgi:phage shock protein PspC (stress-responsive transcriptional regulator)